MNQLPSRIFRPGTTPIPEVYLGELEQRLSKKYLKRLKRKARCMALGVKWYTHKSTNIRGIPLHFMLSNRKLELQVGRVCLYFSFSWKGVRKVYLEKMDVEDAIDEVLSERQHE